jgi:branched-chain amino acid transport system permease protein
MSDVKSIALSKPAPRLRLTGVTLFVAGALAIVPLVFPHPFVLTVLTQAAIFAIAAMSLDLLLGFTGLASFGQAAFFGLGAYAAAIVGLRYSAALPLTLGAAIAAAGLAALLGGWIAIRASGIYFIFLTLALSQLVFAGAFKWRTLTGGDDGLSGLPRPSLGILDRVVDLADDRAFYIFTLLIAVAVWLLLRQILRSCFGSVLTGIRDNSGRMRAIGYDIKRYKITAFLISGCLTGLAGALFSYQYQLVTPEQAHWQTSALIMIMVILGGSGSLVGPAIGALVIVFLQNVLSTYTDRWASVMALMFILVVMFARGGIWGLFGTALRARRLDR